MESVESFKIEKAFYNFDNFWQAIGSAFAMFTFDDWHKLVLQCVNAKTVGPFRNHEAQASVTMPLFFFVFAGCSSFLITFLFVGVIYGTFTCLQLTRGPTKDRLPETGPVVRLRVEASLHPSLQRTAGTARVVHLHEDVLQGIQTSSV